jgi:hypothetical protein
MCNAWDGIWMLDKPHASSQRQTIIKIIHLVSSHCCADRKRAILQYCETMFVTYEPYQRVSMVYTVNRVTIRLAVATAAVTELHKPQRPAGLFHVQTLRILNTFYLPFWVIRTTNSDYFCKRYYRFIFVMVTDCVKWLNGTAAGWWGWTAWSD